MSDNSHIYCDHCESIQPLMKDEMFGKDTTGKFGSPTDLVCATCRLVIATTYTPLYVHDERKST